MSKTNCCTINQVKRVVGHAEIQSKKRLKVQIIVALRNLSSYFTYLFCHIYTRLAVKGKMKLKTEFYFQTYNLFSFLLHHNVHLAVLIFNNYCRPAQFKFIFYLFVLSYLYSLGCEGENETKD